MCSEQANEWSRRGRVSENFQGQGVYSSQRFPVECAKGMCANVFRFGQTRGKCRWGRESRFERDACGNSADGTTWLLRIWSPRDPERDIDFFDWHLFQLRTVPYIPLRLLPCRRHLRSLTKLASPPCPPYPLSRSRHPSRLRTLTPLHL